MNTKNKLMSELVAVNYYKNGETVIDVRKFQFGEVNELEIDAYINEKTRQKIGVSFPDLKKYIDDWPNDRKQYLLDVIERSIFSITGISYYGHLHAPPYYKEGATIIKKIESALNQLKSWLHTYEE